MICLFFEIMGTFSKNVIHLRALFWLYIVPHYMYDRYNFTNFVFSTFHSSPHIYQVTCHKKSF